MDIKKALIQQENEINDYALYSALAHREKKPHNISANENKRICLHIYYNIKY